ncbi:hypothetical protein GGR60_001826 [Xanthomonas arboricola]|uniref:Uncharacterized protein n=1 Tax=Xanthomonas euroxanthea TaxID=2259622 RepID=A0A8E4EIC9_9XANT|nr:hypothetical protein [Xanthomonas euroxanthea]NJC37291.1 hypothetical protein [Xanthomonas euroxanthea]CAD1786173.1 hypothetical protein XSP_000174 [Xanthomonas euroxanthea]
MTKKDFSGYPAFHKLMAALAAMSEDEFGRLNDPSYNLEIRLVRRKVKDDVFFEISEDEEMLFSSVKMLISFSSRKEAQDFLIENFPNKKNLEAIARKIDIPIIKQDKIDDLRDKIVEATVGAKIRSNAIQGSGT